MRIRILSSVHFVITILLSNVVWKSILIQFMTIRAQTLPQGLPPSIYAFFAQKVNLKFMLHKQRALPYTTTLFKKFRTL